MMTDENQPFAQTTLDSLVRFIEDSDAVRVKTHEGVKKEFKETFSWGSMGIYARTMASFANASGGYLIFGVTDRPRIAKGLTQRGLRNFDELDRAKFTDSLNSLFSPEIKWETRLLQLTNTITLGLIYTFESQNKPVISRKTTSEQNARLVEGDILYRYNSQSERAKYPEVKQIIEDAKTRENRSMMEHIKQLVKAGASNAAVLDFNSGMINGSSGDRILVSEDLLKKISFIREGEFEETQGAPTLRLIGDVKPTNTIEFGHERVVLQAITTEDIISNFLDQTHGTDPVAYIKQAVSGSTSFVPVNFYRVEAEMTIPELISFIEHVNTRSQAKPRLLKRLREKDAMKLKPPSDSQQHPSTIQRRRFYNLLTSTSIPKLSFRDEKEAQNFLEAVRSLSNETIIQNNEALLRYTKKCFDVYYQAAGHIADCIRRASCRIDIAMYGDTLA